MRSNRLSVADWTVGSKITALTFALVGAILAGLLVTLSWTTSSMLHARAVDKMQGELRSLVNGLELFDKALSDQTVSYGRIFAGGFDGAFALDATNKVKVGEREVPTLTNGGKPINLDFSHADLFTRETGGNATVFVLDGDDFVRISTSVKKEDGERAVGTVLDHASPAYAAIRAGKPYVGLAKLFGKQTMTDYEPIRDAGGRTIGILYVGVDVDAAMTFMKGKIKALKVGETGYFYVLKATPGKNYGDLIVHPAKEGQNILASRDSNGREFIREMLDKHEGLTTYPWTNAEEGEHAPRTKIAAYTLFKDWNWLIVGGTYEDEITREAAQLRNRYIVIGLVALAVFAAILHGVMKRVVTRPLDAARDAAERIAHGDLTVRMDAARRDEIGLLAQAMNNISSGLSEVVGQVRTGAEQIATASSEISVGNLDLCSRTEEQAASLASTANAMHDLTETVRRNAGDALQANQLAVNTSMVAQEGGRMVTEVIDTMNSIKASSGKINDIIGVIDGIAFQTNILALNAAVEAAQPGPAQRRGGARDQDADPGLQRRSRSRQPRGRRGRRHDGGSAQQRRPGDDDHGAHQRRQRRAERRHRRDQPLGRPDGRGDPAECRAGRTGQRRRPGDARAGGPAGAGGAAVQAGRRGRHDRRRRPSRRRQGALGRRLRPRAPACARGAFRVEWRIENFRQRYRSPRVRRPVRPLHHHPARPPRPYAA
jgi:methyl-accepting chemotaxis protein